MDTTNQSPAIEVQPKKSLDVSVTEDNIKRLVGEFLTKNAAKVEAVTNGTGWSQQVSAWALAYVMADVMPEAPVDFKTMAKFLQQDSLHGLCGNSSQFKQWYFGKSAVTKKSVSIDDLAE